MKTDTDFAVVLDMLSHMEDALESKIEEFKQNPDNHFQKVDPDLLSQLAQVSYAYNLVNSCKYAYEDKRNEAERETREVKRLSTLLDAANDKIRGLELELRHNTLPPIVTPCQRPSARLSDSVKFLACDGWRRYGYEGSTSPKIQAIRKYREETNHCLADAKHAVEAFMASPEYSTYQAKVKTYRLQNDVERLDSSVKSTSTMQHTDQVRDAACTQWLLWLLQNKA